VDSRREGDLMGYVGDTFQIPMDRGGLNASPDVDGISSEAMVPGSKNINMHKGGRVSRGSTSHVDSLPHSGNPEIVGLFDFQQDDGSTFLLRAGNDGTIYKNDTDTIKTGLTADAITSFEVLNDEAYITNGNDIPQVWDGTGNTSNLALVPTDWTGTNYPKQMVKHGRGNSERLWAIGTGKNVYASDSNDGVSEADFSDANVEVFYIETGDGDGIVGGVEFGDRLVVFSKQRSYIIDDSDANTANWGYQEAQWRGGVGNHRLIVRTPNDIVCMAEDGNIYSVTTAEQYGDYKQASLARPAFIDEFIRTKLNLTNIENFHGVYDPELRAIIYFVSTSGNTDINTALVYFTDRGAEEGWMIHDNLKNPSGYNARCSALVEIATGQSKVYTGNYSGRVWKLNQDGKADNNLAFDSGFKFSRLSFGDPRTTKHFHRGRILAHAAGNYDLTISVWIDGVAKPDKTISLSGQGGIMDVDLMDAFVIGGEFEPVDRAFYIRAVGKRIELEIKNNNVDEPFFISMVMIDFKPLGIRP
jgi:hypothetical protein